MSVSDSLKAFIDRQEVFRAFVSAASFLAAHIVSLSGNFMGIIDPRPVFWTIVICTACLTTCIAIQLSQPARCWCDDGITFVD
jgi:hypothetical protein